MPDAKAQLLGRILDALYAAEFCLPGDKAQRESDYLQLLEETSRWSGKSASLIKEAILKDRYPQYRKDRLKRELPSVPAKLRRN